MEEYRNGCKLGLYESIDSLWALLEDDKKVVLGRSDKMIWSMKAIKRETCQRIIEINRGLILERRKRVIEE